jgi:hypothetical protein
MELFQQVTNGLRADNSKERGKRREPRVGISCEASVVSGLSEEFCKSQRIQVRDLSRTGVGLIMPQPMDPGQRFIIELFSDGGQFWMLCEAIYCRPMDKTVFKIGAKHTRVLNPEEVRRLAATMLLSPSPEDREMNRIRVAILN